MLLTFSRSWYLNAFNIKKGMKVNFNGFFDNYYDRLSQSRVLDLKAYIELKEYLNN